MTKDMCRLTLLALCGLSLGACAGRYEGHRGVLVDAQQNVTNRPGIAQHFPALQHHPAPLGPVQDAYPIVEPAIVKQVWIYPHKNSLGDVIGGHYVFVIFKEPKFADLPRGTTRIPVAPQFEQLDEDCTGCPVPGSAPTSAPQPAAPPATPPRAAQKNPMTSDLMKQIEHARQRFLSQHSSPVLSSPQVRPEDRH